VERVIANFGEGLSPEMIEMTAVSELEVIIRPAGFFRQKAIYLKTVTEWFAGYEYDVSAVRREPLEKVRTELLSVKGVGPETADSILLYAFGFPTFVVDAYTFRLCARYPIDAGKTYDSVRKYFEKSLPHDAKVYNNFHALIVTNAKEHCRKKPACTACPLNKTCKQITVF